MSERIDYRQVAPGAMKAMLGLEGYVRESGLEASLLELVRLRASQINGCAYCVDMHTKDARAAGETEQRLYAVSVWREAPFFSERERAALAWTEVVTEVSRAGVPDEAYAAAREHFSEQELVNLTMAIVAINGWNRIAIAFRPEVGSYQPRGAKE
ncbi:MAG TPA: carboxymuconolactone decarboxylase family protein [Longimicrobiales bacterium]